MTQFRLEKWYLDVASDGGEAFIGYAAKLKWKWINLNYAGYTFLNSRSVIKKRNSFSRTPFPEVEGNKMQWKGLDCEASWSAKDGAISEILYEDEKGSIIWNCLFPKASSRVRVGTNVVDGFGYAESLQLTMLPWKLPIHELHWGRFLTADETIIWIRWIGPVPKTIVYHNSRRFDHVEIASDKIVFGEFTLDLRNSISMRTGTLFANVFSRFPSLAKLFPKSILQLQENKWLSNGTLYRNSTVIAFGKAIHEVVRWKA